MINFEFKSLTELTKKLNTQKKCEDFLFKVRWCKKAICPYCNSDKTYKTSDRLKCNTCNTKFSVLVNTIFENTKLPLLNWFVAIYLSSSNKKGISSCQLAKHLGITQKTAWSMLQKIKHIAEDKVNIKFNGIVEADECYVGGKFENKHMKERIRLKEKDNKMVVFGMINRDTNNIKLINVKDASAEELQNQIYNKVKNGSVLMTDTFKSYHSISNSINHQTVNHSKGEYVKERSFERRGEERKSFKVHTNTIEGCWSLVKRTIYGTHHWISKKHIQKYLNEIEFRYNFKDLSENERFNNLFSRVVNNKITYKSIIA